MAAVAAEICLWEHIINIAVYFVGYLYIMDLIMYGRWNILKNFVHFISYLDVGYFSSFHEERKARLLMNSLVPRIEGALFLATSLFQ